MSDTSSAPTQQLTSGVITDLTQLYPKSGETIECPSCNQQAQTSCQGRSKAAKTALNLLFWPLPDREHWFESVKWYCGNCEVKLAKQRIGKNVRVLV